ncbi:MULTISPECIES: hypothetical protein [unclassified Spirillospora]|uniref:hypothetical protein n=1 Tax=unclassified Spirillospora TaxID=2642701 RepID=UPI0037199712
MRSTRLAAAGVAAGAMVLGMAGPALADGKASASPNPFTAGSKITVTVEGCETKPVLAHQGTMVFNGLVKFTQSGTTWTSAPVATFDSRHLKAGQSYDYKVTCYDPNNKKLTLTLPLTVAKPDGNDPTPTPTTPTFKFGYDKVKLSTTRVAPGQKVTFTVNCPTAVTVSGNGYTKNPLPVKKTGDATWTAQGTYRSNPPDPTTVTVVCKDFGSVKYSTSPEKGTGNGTGTGMKPKTPKIPTGPINTGDGSSLGTDGSPMMAAAWGAFMFLGLGAVALRRRTVSERS